MVHEALQFPNLGTFDLFWGLEPPATALGHAQGSMQRQTDIALSPIHVRFNVTSASCRIASIVSNGM